MTEEGPVQYPLTIFDSTASESRKKRGMLVAAKSKTRSLDLARDIAHELCLKHGEITADDVGRVLRYRYGIHSLGPAAGSLFKNGEFETTGEMRKSARQKNHARLLYVWRLRSTERD